MIVIKNYPLSSHKSVLGNTEIKIYKTKKEVVSEKLTKDGCPEEGEKTTEVKTIIVMDSIL